jgi:hypothetical protein
MRTAKELVSVQEAGFELLGFRSVRRPDRLARVTRAVNAKVGFKNSPPRQAQFGRDRASFDDRSASEID